MTTPTEIIEHASFASPKQEAPENEIHDLIHKMREIWFEPLRVQRPPNNYVVRNFDLLV